MEILFIGIAVVALMAYVSTRIKKSAAAAFEEEAVNTSEFSLIKPEGFLSPVENDEFLAYYAYSKEYGEDEGVEKVRQALIKVKSLAGRKLADIVREKRAGIVKVVRDEKSGDGSVLLFGEREEKGIDKFVYYKFCIREESIFELEMTVLGDYFEKYEAAAEKLTRSFRVV